MSVFTRDHCRPYLELDESNPCPVTHIPKINFNIIRQCKPGFPSGFSSSDIRTIILYAFLIFRCVLHILSNSHFFAITINVLNTSVLICCNPARDARDDVHTASCLDLRRVG